MPISAHFLIQEGCGSCTLEVSSANGNNAARAGRVCTRVRQTGTQSPAMHFMALTGGAELTQVNSHPPV